MARPLLLNRLRPVTLVAALLGLALGAAGARGAEEVYLFYLRKDLDRLIRTDSAAIVGKRVVVTDELAVLWPSRPERKNQLDGTDHVVFDTVHFHCLVPRSQMGDYLESIWADAEKGYADVIERIEAVNERQRKRDLTPAQANEDRRRLYWELYRIWSNRPIVTLFGRVERSTLWGRIHPAASGRVQSERVVLRVDRIEEPRERWTHSLDE